MACVDRIGSLIDDGAPAAPAAPKPLASALRLEGAGLERRIGPLDLALKSGSRVALLGATGSGKSSLLRMLAGLESPDQGRIRWDDEAVAPAELLARVGFLGQESAFTRGRVWRILGLVGPEAPAPEAIELLGNIGAWKLIEKMPRGLKEKVASPTLSRNEARLLKLGGLLLGGAPAWVMDGPFDGLSVRRSRRCLATILAKAGPRTVVISLARPVGLERFDRVIALRDGKIWFDGSPQEWNERKLLKH